MVDHSANAGLGVIDSGGDRIRNAGHKKPGDGGDQVVYREGPGKKIFFAILIFRSDSFLRGEWTMIHSVSSDRRQDRRYLVVGTGVIRTSRGEFPAELVNVGTGGMLAFCDAAFPLGERVDVRFHVQDYPLEVKVPGRVVHTAVGLVGITIPEEPEELEEVLLWLEAGFMACLL